MCVGFKYNVEEPDATQAYLHTLRNIYVSVLYIENRIPQVKWECLNNLINDIAKKNAWNPVTKFLSHFC